MPVPPQADGHARRAGDRSAAAERVQPASESETSQSATAGKKANGEPLSEGEERQVRELKKTDAKVRAHEQAHAQAGGPYASAPSYEFTTGPDGKRYATSGEVQIDTSPVRGDPEATIRKMDIVIRAALAPAEPSSQDLAVARAAQQQRAEAQAELFKQREAERSGESDDSSALATAPAEGNRHRPGAPPDLLAEAHAAYAAAADEVVGLLARST